MVEFTKLRATGFKSFADQTEMDILPGLTGIVGPNGCGKSNMTEALRWLMGETSPKSMRGSGMEDVIFAGTGKRPARNFAEVVLTLNNPNKTAPEPYTDVDTLEVSRRIDRGMGSEYRINGKVVRAADVQLLFADSATGANSPSIVSQGRVAHLISAKPVERRRVLEDAAAVSGLHNRRKEAETRLRAAEKNLTRVDDLVGQKSGLYQELVKQAKQAERYRTLSDTIRSLEALSMAMEWTRVFQDIEAAQASMIVANEAQNQAKQAMYDLSKQRESLQNSWDHVERQIQDLTYKIQQQVRNKERAEEELQRYEQTRADLEQQLQSLTHDSEYEQEALTEATSKIESLKAEQADLESKIANFTTDLEKNLAARDAAKAAYDAKQQELSQKRSEHASLTAQRNMLNQQLQRALNEKNNLVSEQERVANILTQLASDMETSDVTPLHSHVQQLEQTLQATLDNVTQLEKQSEAAAVTTKSVYEDLQAAQSVLNRIDTEIKALEALTNAPSKSQSFPVMLDQIQVDGGFEEALAVAMGRELRAGLDSSAPMYWQDRNDSILPDLPQGAKSMVTLAQAPQALKAALSMIGVVEDKTTGDALSADLKPGQMLVSKDGYGWRWDGYTVTPQAQASAQERETKQLLEQRNRLVVLREEREEAAANTEKANGAYQAALEHQNTMRDQTMEGRHYLHQLQHDMNQARQQLASAQHKQAEVQARQQSLQEKQSDLNIRLTQAEQNYAQVETQITALPPEEESLNALQALQSETTEKEQAYREADQAYLAMNTQQTQWQQRLGSVGRELQEWTQREQNATQRSGNITERLAKLNEAMAQLKSPEHVHEHMEQADRAIKGLEGEMFELNTRRTEISQERQNIDKKNQEEQEALMGARETLARAETQFQNGQMLKEQLVERCQQNLGCLPDEVVEQFQFTEEDLEQNIQTIRSKQERARNERDRIGAVNLRAEEESQTLATELETLTKEKDDILAAIEKLRHGINTLNRDARKKMLAAFEEVNTRFKEVFTRLFNGGEAYLQLIDAEDPLEAGLEIFAQPPGKRLQTLTLLSGGEQSLTAIALIFSMFLTHPSPICILDEIDAALDDANVERICSLLTDFTKTHTHTRFLVITHNPITMASLHRLYGVTMVEKGVSKLVSVDLERTQQQHLALAAE